MYMYIYQQHVHMTCIIYTYLKTCYNVRVFHMHVVHHREHEAGMNHVKCNKVTKRKLNYERNCKSCSKQQPSHDAVLPPIPQLRARSLLQLNQRLVALARRHHGGSTCSRYLLVLLLEVRFLGEMTSRVKQLTASPESNACMKVSFGIFRMI